MDDSSRTTSDDATARWRYGLWAVLGGFAAVAFCVTVALIRYDSAESGAAAVAPAIAAISALAGAYFGVQAGSSGKAEADAARDAAQLQALRFAAVADPERALAVLDGPPPRPADERASDGDLRVAGDDAISARVEPRVVDHRATDEADASRAGAPSGEVIGARPASQSATETTPLRQGEREMPI